MQALIQHAIRLHAALPFTILVTLVIAGALLLVSERLGRASGQESSIKAGDRAGLWICELLIAAECLLGALLWASGTRPARPEVHAIYGFVALLALPALWLYTRSGGASRRKLALGIGCLFTCAIVLRALATARPPG
jgi:hypothetical protein